MALIQEGYSPTGSYWFRILFLAKGHNSYRIVWRWTLKRESLPNRASQPGFPARLVQQYYGHCLDMDGRHHRVGLGDEEAEEQVPRCGTPAP
jgi:hypothetical protein